METKLLGSALGFLNRIAIVRPFTVKEIPKLVYESLRREYNTAPPTLIRMGNLSWHIMCLKLEEPFQSDSAAFGLCHMNSFALWNSRPAVLRGGLYIEDIDDWQPLLTIGASVEGGNEYLRASVHGDRALFTMSYVSGETQRPLIGFAGLLIMLAQCLYAHPLCQHPAREDVA